MLHSKHRTMNTFLYAIKINLGIHHTTLYGLSIVTIYISLLLRRSRKSGTRAITNLYQISFRESSFLWIVIRNTIFACIHTAKYSDLLILTGNLDRGCNV